MVQLSNKCWLAGAAIGGILVLPAASSISAKPSSPVPVPAAAPTPELINMFAGGNAGFVVSDMQYAFGPDAKLSGACPSGMTMTARDAFLATPDGKQRQGEADGDYRRRVQMALAPARGLPNACASPELNPPDPNHRLVSGANVKTYGIDLDGQDSRARGRAAPGTCAHDDFRGMAGERGVDNQMYRALGCAAGFQSTGAHIGFVTEMLTGAWGILISLKGVDDVRNDPSVEVGIYANADPIQLSSGRKPLTYASYATDRDPRFRATTKGRIVNGVLTTDPVTVRFHSTINNMWLERPMDDARLRMTINGDGSLEGILAGYTGVEELYDYLVGYRSAKDANGKPAGRRTGSAGGSAAAAGVSCNGLYHALKQVADGHRDPKTGKCSAVSTQYRIKAIPAFVVESPAPNPSLTASSK
jgi:hypothetical protein